MPDSVEYIGHVSTRDHNVFNCSPMAVLDVNRESMARYGHSPATRVFEAAGAAACLITDAAPGIEQFLEPGAKCWSRRMVTRSRRNSPRSRRRARDGGRERSASPGAPPAHLRASCRHPAGAARRGRPSATRMAAPLRLVFIGLSITSSWGNGHATTYRSLLAALARRGHLVRFLERDVPWYAEHRDELSLPGVLYQWLDDLRPRFTRMIRTADAVIIGSYVPEGDTVGAWVLREAQGVRAFYDIDTPITLTALPTTAASTCHGAPSPATISTCRSPADARWRSWRRSAPGEPGRSTAASTSTRTAPRAASLGSR